MFIVLISVLATCKWLLALCLLNLIWNQYVLPREFLVCWVGNATTYIVPPVVNALLLRPAALACGLDNKTHSATKGRVSVIMAFIEPVWSAFWWFRLWPSPSTHVKRLPSVEKKHFGGIAVTLCSAQCLGRALEADSHAQPKATTEYPNLTAGLELIVNKRVTEWGDWKCGSGNSRSRSHGWKMQEWKM